MRKRKSIDCKRIALRQCLINEWEIRILNSHIYHHKENEYIKYDGLHVTYFTICRYTRNEIAYNRQITQCHKIGNFLIVITHFYRLLDMFSKINPADRLRAANNITNISNIGRTIASRLFSI